MMDSYYLIKMHVYTCIYRTAKKKKQHKKVFVFYLNYIHTIKWHRTFDAGTQIPLPLMDICWDPFLAAIFQLNAADVMELWLIFHMNPLNHIFTVKNIATTFCSVQNANTLHINAQTQKIPILKRRRRPSWIIRLILILNFWKSNSSLAWRFYYSCVCVCVFGGGRFWFVYVKTLSYDGIIHT